MVFSSLTFLLLFLPVTVGLYFALPGIRWKNSILLIASVLFYAWGEPMWVFVLMGLALLVWLCSAGVAKWQNKWLRRFALAVGVADQGIDITHRRETFGDKDNPYDPFGRKPE